MKQGSGTVSGLIGIAIFSGSLPATRLAEAGFPPLFLTAARAVIAALLGLALLLALRQPRPGRDAVIPLLSVALGVVVGYPLLSACALQHIDAVRSAMWTGLLPLSTALFAVLRKGERPSLAFWLLSLAGAGAVTGYALTQTHGGSLLGDGLMLAAILVCGLGYAEGAALSRSLGGWQVISWALLLALVPMGILALCTHPRAWGEIPHSAWGALAYVALFSMMLGFVFWYHGLAQGGIARIGQLQLLQPFGGLALSALILGERIPPLLVGVSLIVLGCVFGARRTA
ncbi:EamA family transporter [Asaia sp. W19]|uniref:DMT family transporter n=1 Tax=unclassified Asaia TaxID=2685023 RepID=UPI000F8F5F05|nr:DMT family transporter [Asaia sp. W19]RUT25950.1 EamA family transporter [Asaia sp. W19]